MKRYRGPLLLAGLALCFVGLLLWVLYADARSPDRPEIRISVVAYGADNDRWRALDQGIRQACAELGIEKPVVTVLRRDGPLQLDSLLEREIAGGSKGLLVASANRQQGEAVAAVSQQIPVVLLESGLGDSLPCVRADDAGMGRLLADAVIQNGGHAAVLKSGLDRESVSERYEAFAARMAERNVDFTVLDGDGIDGDPKSFLAGAIATCRPPLDALAVLDNDALEMAVEALPAAMVDTVKLYGIGCSDSVVHALDTGGADAIVFQNEYAIGYLGTMRLAAEMGMVKSAPAADIQYSLVTGETMYQPEQERLLFPIIQ